MLLNFSPMRHPEALTLSRAGDCLVINGESFDFSGIPEGATLPRTAVNCPWLASDIDRIDAQLHLTLILPHGVHAPQDTLFPEVVLASTDGPIALPAYELPEEEGFA